MDGAAFRRLAAMDASEREAWLEALFQRADRAPSWQRQVLRKRLEELRLAIDSAGGWDQPEHWIPAPD